MDRDERDKLIKRIADCLPEKEDMLREARQKLDSRIFHPSFHMGAYYVKIKVMKELEAIFEEDIAELKKKLK